VYLDYVDDFFTKCRPLTVRVVYIARLVSVLLVVDVKLTVTLTAHTHTHTHANKVVTFMNVWFALQNTYDTMTSFSRVKKAQVNVRHNKQLDK